MKASQGKGFEGVDDDVGRGLVPGPFSFPYLSPFLRSLHLNRVLDQEIAGTVLSHLTGCGTGVPAGFLCLFPLWGWLPAQSPYLPQGGSIRLVRGSPYPVP